MELPDETLIQSYVWHNDDCFFVSTIDRDSSAVLGPRRFSETLVWGYDWKKRESKSLRYERDGIRHSIYQHLKICQELFETGELKDPNLE